MTPFPVPVRVISLTQAETRRARVTAELQRLDIAFSFFDGVDGHAREEELLAKTDISAWHRFMGAPVAAGHLGCYASHVHLWEEIAEGPDEIVLVCEDDIVLQDGFRAAVGAALSCHKHWDICRFAKVRAKWPVSLGRVGEFSLNAYIGPFTGNACYLINRDVAGRLAHSFWPIRRAHDHELNRFFHYDFRLTGLEPFTAVQEDQGESFITGTGMSKARKFPKWKRLPHYAHKAANYFRRLRWLALRGVLTSKTHRLDQN